MKKKQIAVVLGVAFFSLSMMGCGAKSQSSGVNMSTVGTNVESVAGTEEATASETAAKTDGDNTAEVTAEGNSVAEKDAGAEVVLLAEDVRAEAVVGEDTENILGFVADEEYTNVLKVYYKEALVYEYVDELPLCRVSEPELIDLDHDGAKEVFISYEPMVNSMPLMEYVVLKPTINDVTGGDNVVEAWETLTIPEGDVVTYNSFPISVKCGENLVYEISVEGYEEVFTFDAYQHYEEESAEVGYEGNPYERILAGTYEYSYDGGAAAWGVWEIVSGEYEGAPCLIATQGIQGPEGKWDMFGTLLIYFDFSEDGHWQIQNLVFEEY